MYTHTNFELRKAQWIVVALLGLIVGCLPVSPTLSFEITDRGGSADNAKQRIVEIINKSGSWSVYVPYSCNNRHIASAKPINWCVGEHGVSYVYAKMRGETNVYMIISSAKNGKLTVAIGNKRGGKNSLDDATRTAANWLHAYVEEYYGPPNIGDVVENHPN